MEDLQKNEPNLESNASGEDQDIIAVRRVTPQPAPQPAPRPAAGAVPHRRPIRRPVRAARPTPGNPRPTPGAARPVPGNPRPAPGAARPVPGNPRPAQGAARPVPGNPRPAQGVARPVPGNPRPAQGAVRPVPGNPQPAQGAVRPTPVEERPAQSAPQNPEGKTRALPFAAPGFAAPAVPEIRPESAPLTSANEASPVPPPEATRRAPEPVERKATRKEKRQKVTSDGRPVEIRDRGGVSSSILKALLYIVFVLIVSGFLAVYGIRAANDIFAFVKDDVTVEVEIPSEASLKEVSAILYDNGLIEDANWFQWYTGFKYRKKELVFVGGKHTLSSAMNYNSMIAELTPKNGRTIVTVTIPEGFTVDEIIDLFLEKGMGTREGFIDAIQNYDYSYQFLDVLNSIELSENRKYRLEGYLFPDTYDFYTDSSEIAIIDKMLADFQARFEEEDYDRCIALGMNIDEVVTLASIIQEEAHFSSDMYYISAVFHNRLNNSAQFPYLQSDATVQYALPEHKEQLTGADLQVDSPYNTHLYKGLPPGAICSPGIDAITAALYPEDYLAESGQKSYYFIAGTDGYSLFAATYDGHLRNQAAVEAQKAA